MIINIGVRHIGQLQMRPMHVPGIPDEVLDLPLPEYLPADTFLTLLSAFVPTPSSSMLASVTLLTRQLLKATSAQGSSTSLPAGRLLINRTLR